MSNNETEKWLESRQEDFDQALIEGEIDLAVEIEKDVRDNGFDTTVFKGFADPQNEVILESYRLTKHDD